MPAPGRGWQSPVGLVGQVDPGEATDPELLRPRVQRPAVGMRGWIGVAPRAEVVEEVIRRDSQRVDEIQ
jgi:hypothetical protein